MPSDVALKGMNVVHRIITKVSFGKLGWSAAGMPVVELTTTGRKSGQRRSVMLTSPVQPSEGTWVLVASKGGEPEHPAWYLNLRDHPEVEISVGGGPAQPMVARTAEGDERARLWAELTAAQPRYAGYQRKTDREIPVVVVEPPAA